MTSNLLAEFLREECIPGVLNLIKEALAVDAPPIKRFEFNRFEVTIDREARVVLIQDVLDAEDSGSLRVSLSDFTAAVNSYRV